MLAYRDIGSGTAIVFIHGVGSRKEAWDRQHPLAEKYRLIIPDLRGHGETALEDGISMYNFAHDIIELLDYLNIDEAYICGLSLGGVVAQELYRQKPSVVKGLLLANTAAYIDPILASGIVFTAYANHKDKDFTKEIANKGLYNKQYVQEAEEAFLIRKSYLEAVTAAIGVNYFPTLVKVDKPVLVVSGSDDKVTPSINQLWMYAALHNAQPLYRVVLRDTGHLSNIDSADDFNKLIDNFIKETSYGKR